MRHAERFALNQWLCAYPDNTSYDQILKMVLDGDPNIPVWSYLEGKPTYFVADAIEETKIEVERMLDNLLCGVRLSDKTEEESRAEGAME